MLRTPTPADYEALATWIPDANACTRWAGPLISFPLSVASLSVELKVANGISYTLTDVDGNPIAFGQYWAVAPSAVHLGRIIVSPHARSRGIGRILCELLIARAVQTTDATTVTLRVYRDNVPALNLYKSLGFIAVASESTEAVLFMKMVGAPVEP